MAVVFREGHCWLHGKIMRTIFHSIKLLHLAQLATHTKVKEKDPFLYDSEVHERARRMSTQKKSFHDRRSFKKRVYFNISELMLVCRYCTFFWKVLKKF